MSGKRHFIISGHLPGEGAGCGGGRHDWMGCAEAVARVVLCCVLCAVCMVCMVWSGSWLCLWLRVCVVVQFVLFPFGFPCFILMYFDLYLVLKPFLI